MSADTDLGTDFEVGLGCTYASVKTYVYTQLGAEDPYEATASGACRGGVGVELTQAQFRAALAQALRIYRQYIIRDQWVDYDLTAGTGIYHLENETVQAGLLEVEFDISAVSTVGINLSLGGDVNYFDPLLDTNLGHYGMGQQFYETSRRALSAESYWEFKPTVLAPLEGDLYISPAPTENLRVALRVIVPTTKPEHIHPTDEDWLNECALAFAERIVGRMRRKFGGALQGQTSQVQLDTQLADEGARKIEETMRQQLIDRYGDGFLRPLLGGDW
jgi:hypothetical protein